MKAVWKDVTLAESEDAINLAGVQYFPRGSITMEHFRESDTHTTCFVKGVASYYDVVVEGEVRRDGAWYYPEPHDNVERIKGYVAFYTNGGVTLVGE